MPEHDQQESDPPRSRLQPPDWSGPMQGGYLQESNLPQSQLRPPDRSRRPLSPESLAQEEGAAAESVEIRKILDEGVKETLENGIVRERERLNSLPVSQNTRRQSQFNMLLTSVLGEELHDIGTKMKRGDDWHIDKDQDAKRAWAEYQEEQLQEETWVPTPANHVQRLTVTSAG